MPIQPLSPISIGSRTPTHVMAPAAIALSNVALTSAVCR